MTVMLDNQIRKIDTKENTGPRYAVQLNQLCGIFLKEIIPGKYWTFGVLLNLTRHHLYLLSTVVMERRIKGEA